MAKKIEANDFSVPKVLRKLEEGAGLTVGDFELKGKKEKHIFPGTGQDIIRQEIFSKSFGESIGIIEMVENPVVSSGLLLEVLKKDQSLDVNHPIFTEKTLVQGRIFV